MAKFVEVILPLPLPTTYTYSVPQELQGKVQAGCRVSVPLGTKNHYTAMVASTHDNEPTDCKVRSIDELLDETPIMFPTQMKLWEWISRYYLSSMGDIYKAAVPQGLKGEFKPRTEQRTRLPKQYCNEKAIDLIKCKAASAAAATVPEYNISLPKLYPLFIPDKTKSNFSFNP